MERTWNVSRSAVWKNHRVNPSLVIVCARLLIQYGAGNCKKVYWPRMLKVAPCTVGRTVVRPNIFGLIGYYSTNGNSPAIRKPWKLWHVLVLHVACLGWKIIKGVLIWTAGENASESTCLKSKGFKLDSETKRRPLTVIPHKQHPSFGLSQD